MERRWESGRARASLVMACAAKQKLKQQRLGSGRAALGKGTAGKWEVVGRGCIRKSGARLEGPARFGFGISQLILAMELRLLSES